ncbi:MAG: 4-fold beta flower protein [Pseudomonadota bacterium]
MNLYTKNGRPLKVIRDIVYSRSGKAVGRIRDKYVYGPNGRYAGTLIDNRVIYRSVDSARIGTPFAATSTVGFALANAVGVATWGDEPDFPD